jgi:TatD DNase family protein
VETDAPWCDIRPTHASHPFISLEFEQKKKERFELGKMIKGRNEPCTIR